MATTKKDYSVRVIAETTQGTTPAGSMLEVPLESFSFTGQAPDREQAGNVSADQQVPDNIPTTRNPQASAASDVLYDHYKLFEAHCCGVAGYTSAITVTATTIAAVVSGNKLTGSGTPWVGLEAGDIVRIDGFATNPASFAAKILTTPTGTDLALDPNWITLLAEAAGPSVTVTHKGRLRLGTLAPTMSVELWNANGVVGQIGRGVGISKWGWELPYPTKLKQTFAFTAITIAAISAQLANATTAAAAQYPMNSNTDFGVALTPTFGGGFRYGGALFDGRVEKLGFEVNKARKTSGKAGTFGPTAQYSDERYSVPLTLGLYRDHADVEAILVDSTDHTTVTSFDWIMADALGRRKAFSFPQVQFSKGDPGGLAQSGEEMVEFALMAKKDPTVGMLQVTLLD